eukprot:m.242742 g.242742  ORF g.242742 m.242742 type:complete len:311 (+) comp40224_c1_seq2:842-1774(+)
MPPSNTCSTTCVFCTSGSPSAHRPHPWRHSPGLSLFPIERAFASGDRRLAELSTVAIRDVTALLVSARLDPSESVHRDFIDFYSHKLNSLLLHRDIYPVSEIYDDYRLYLLLYMLEAIVQMDEVGPGYRHDNLSRLLQYASSIAVAVQSFELFEAIVSAEYGSVWKRLSSAPKCFHGLPAVRSRSNAPGKDGCYYVCPCFNLGKSCGYFKRTGTTSHTQETGAPMCIVHEKPAVVCYSLKLESLGRPYFCCSEEGLDKCRLFSWLEDGKKKSSDASKGQICRHWSLLGQCPYGKGCRFSDSHKASESTSA